MKQKLKSFNIAKIRKAGKADRKSHCIFIFDTCLSSFDNIYQKLKKYLKFLVDNLFFILFIKIRKIKLLRNVGYYF